VAIGTPFASLTRRQDVMTCGRHAGERAGRTVDFKTCCLHHIHIKRDVTHHWRAFTQKNIGRIPPRRLQATALDSAQSRAIRATFQLVMFMFFLNLVSSSTALSAFVIPSYPSHISVHLPLQPPFRPKHRRLRSGSGFVGSGGGGSGSSGGLTHILSLSRGDFLCRGCPRCSSASLS
jgi:hypothetical protein